MVVSKNWQIWGMHDLYHPPIQWMVVHHSSAKIQIIHRLLFQSPNQVDLHISWRSKFLGRMRLAKPISWVTSCPWLDSSRSTRCTHTHWLSAHLQAAFSARRISCKIRQSRVILWQKGQSEERAYVSTSKSVSSFFFSGLRLMGSMNVVASTATSVEDNLKEKTVPLLFWHKFHARVKEAPRWLAGCHLETVLIKDILEKSSVKINSQTNPSQFVLTQVSRVKEGPRWQAGCQLETQER